MIVLHPPKIKTEGEFSTISSVLILDGKENELWYKFSSKFKPFLVTENLDAFLVGILFLALKTGNNITLKGQVSGKLFYSLNHYLIPALVLSNPKFHRVKIFAEKLCNEDLNTGVAAGTGMSCGIDSFATYYDHLNEGGPFKIQYLTFFNVGSHLDNGGLKARKIYEKRLKSVSAFAKEEGKELISVDSNLSEILKMNFQQTHSLRSISCILHLQKLFKNYYYSSAYRFDHFKLNDKDTSDSDILNLSLLGTESTTFFPSAAQFTRVERTLMVAGYDRTYNKLDVCTDPLANVSFVNCSVCYKCLRTQLTLYLAGKLDLYKKVFDIEKFKMVKNQYLGELLGKKDPSILDVEVIAFMRSIAYKPPLRVHYYSLALNLKLQKKRVKYIIKYRLK